MVVGYVTSTVVVVTVVRRGVASRHMVPFPKSFEARLPESIILSPLSLPRTTSVWLVLQVDAQLKIGTGTGTSTRMYRDLCVIEGS